jgi:hypothetical protein
MNKNQFCFWTTWKIIYNPTLTCTIITLTFKCVLFVQPHSNQLAGFLRLCRPDFDRSAVLCMISHEFRALNARVSSAGATPLRQSFVQWWKCIPRSILSEFWWHLLTSNWSTFFIWHVFPSTVQANHYLLQLLESIFVFFLWYGLAKFKHASPMPLSHPHLWIDGIHSVKK